MSRRHFDIQKLSSKNVNGMEEGIIQEGTMMVDVIVTLIVGGGRAVGRGNCRSASLSAGSPQPNRLLYDDPLHTFHQTSHFLI